MVKSSESLICQSEPTNKEEVYPYIQYYLGGRDQDGRKSGHGENHWSGAKSLESYTGRLIRNTMHGLGDYRWQHRGPDSIFVTYEGNFYGNRMHGYGVTSYPDGRVFDGLFYKNIRWGPGVESHVYLREDVGLWNGTQLIRLAWRPSVPSVAIDLMSINHGKSCIEPHRILMAANVKKIGEVNSAIELLKQCGSEPISAAERWTKLYPKHCTDLESQLCHVDVFENAYYKGKIQVLEEVSSLPQNAEELNMENGEDSFEDRETYFAWNNNPTIIHMMKHCFKHEKQRKRSGVNLMSVLSGSRSHFKPAGKHELDCRTLLMASYLGHITNVAVLINESQVHPNVTDTQGNSALMYAACGDQAEIICFLVEAGAQVDEFNDACCTPLGVTLLRYICAVHDITPNYMVQALLSPPVLPAAPQPQEKIFEWNTTRELSPTRPPVIRTASKISKVNTKAMSVKDIPKHNKKSETVGAKNDFQTTQSLESFTEEKRMYYNINNEFNIRVNDLFLLPTPITPVPYLFEVNDMVKDIDATEVEPKKVPDKNLKKIASKPLKEVRKQSQELTWPSTERDEYSSIDSAQKFKNDMLSRIILTILQLLNDGADPRLVGCPQPALLIATAAGSSDLVRHLVNYGADVNEVYPQTLNYTALDIAVSRPFTYENLNLIRTMLECGAKTNHRLQYGDPALQDPNVSEIPGPTLLHAVLARKLDNETDEEIRREVLEMLLDYRCDPLVQFKGRSAVDIALSMDVDVFNIFMKCPRNNLNGIINENNQTVLVKILSSPFCKTIPLEQKLQIVTNLLLFGADPLAECQNGEDKYKNLFVYARAIFKEFENSQSKPASAGKVPETKGKKSPPPKKDEGKKPPSKKDNKLTTKQSKVSAVDDLGDYKQTLDLATECARLLYIRWLQAKLAKELIEVVHKYIHRQWNVTLREHKNKKATGLWLTTQRCIEIWDILKTTRRKIYNDRRILKHTLYIVQYYTRNLKESLRNSYISAEEKDSVESDVMYLLHEHRISSNLAPEITLTRPYVMPELAVRANYTSDCHLTLQPLRNTVTVMVRPGVTFIRLLISLSKIIDYSNSSLLQDEYSIDICCSTP